MRRPMPALVIVFLSMQCLMLVLGFLVVAEAHHSTAAADGPAHVEGTCGAGPAVLQGGVRTLAIGSLQLTSSPVNNLELSPLQALAYPPSTLERPCVTTGNCHQDKLHCFMHIFLC